MTRTDRYGNSFPYSDFWFLQLPFSILFGWFMFLTFVGIFSAFSTISEKIWNPSGWSVVIQIFLVIISFIVLRSRYDPFFVAPISWGLFAIADNNQDDSVVLTSSLVCAIILGIATIATVIHLFFHHYLRRAYIGIN